MAVIIGASLGTAFSYLVLGIKDPISLTSGFILGSLFGLLLKK